jgi:HK97 family phage major capsid protein
MPDTATLIKEITEELKKTQKAQFEEIEPQIKEAILSGKGVAELSEKMTKANTEVARCIETLQALDNLVKKEKEDQTKRIDGLEARLGEDEGGIQIYKTIGQRYIEHFNEEQFNRAYDENKMPSVKIKLDAQWIYGAIGKSISTAAASAGTLADSLRLPGVVTQPEPALVVQAMIATRTIENRTVDYVRELVFTDLTATVAETTDDTSLVAKPKGDITFELITDTMNTIAQWIPASRQSLRYATRTDLLNYIDGRLRDRVLLELENQVLTGDGTGTNFGGIIPNATVYNRGFDPVQGADPTEVDTLRRAITQLQLANYFPTGIILHPSDWEEIDLNKDTQLRYILAGSPQGVNSRTLWGVPVMVSNQMVSTEFLIGDFRATTMELMIGNALTVRIAEQHAEFFTANMVAILAEMDGLLAFYRPEAIINGELELAS